LYDSFGASVAVSGNLVVIGSPKYSSLIHEATGAADVYDLSSATPTVPVLTLYNPEPGEYEEFGYSLAMSGSRLVVGCLGIINPIRRARPTFMI
jgi:hypothetical protein